MSCPLCSPSKNVIARHNYWTVVLNDDQGYLGRCYVALNRHETDVSNISTDELIELWQLFAWVKTALTQLWEPDHFNYVFLMNVQPHLHGHIIPRYATSREVNGQTFNDGKLGQHYDLENVIIPEDTVLTGIALKIATAMELTQ